MIRRAQTLLEAVLAIAVILVSVISATALLVTTIFSAQSSEDKIQAANLAREGIEMVRAVRDSNWMKITTNELQTTGVTYAWNTSNDDQSALGGDTVKDYYPQFTLAGHGVLKKCTQTSCNSQTGLLVVKKAMKNTGTTHTFYTQGDFATNGCPDTYTCTPTKFSRLLRITPGSEQPFGETSPTIDYLEVRATVTWNNKGARQYSVTERLYNWR